MEKQHSDNFCETCNIALTPVWFTEYEYNHGTNARTGRKRRALAYFVCERCLNKTITDDDYMAGSWYR